jgi:hypothetical protein
MPRGGRRTGAGRKPSGKVALLVRVNPRIRGAIEREAERGGRSLSAQVEAMLIEAARDGSRAGRRSRALGYLVVQLCTVMQAAGRNASVAFDWRNSRFDHAALRHAIDRLLARMAPAGGVEKRRYAQYATPEELGRTAAETVLALATLGKGRAYELAESRKAGIGSPFYGLPQVAEVLGLG